MQKSAKPTTRTQQPAKPTAPVAKQAGPQPLDAQQLRQVSGGNSLPNKGW